VANGRIDEEAIGRTQAIIHLAGANVAGGRWTAAYKEEIRNSRVKSGTLLVNALSGIRNDVETVISSSATGWYGEDPQIPNPKPFTEEAPPATDFLGSTCKQWEESIQPVAATGRRLVIIRTGIVLSPEGGAYTEFKKSLPFGVASVLGNGRQVVSWIHIDDIVRMYVTALQQESWQGVYNGVAPQPASNREIIMAIARESGRAYVPVSVPTFALRLALGEMSVEVLKSATVSSAKVQRASFPFNFPTVNAAAKDLKQKAS
jgi:uncharacterized protein (TIGR01777 family)